MNTTESFDTNYHSTLLLLGTRDQAPPNFWGPREVFEVPSSRDAVSQRRTFSCCGSLQVGLDRESRALRERKKQREEKHRNEKWCETYGKALNRSSDDLDHLRNDLVVAAKLHNVVLEHQESGGGGFLGEFDPILIRFNGERSQGGRVVNLGILKNELAVALAGVTAFSDSPKIISRSVTRDSTVNAPPKQSVSKPIAQGGTPKRFSALIPGSFKNYMIWPGEKVETSEEPPVEIQTYLPKKSQDTHKLTVSPELALAATKQPDRDSVISKMSFPLGLVSEEEEEVEKG